MPNAVITINVRTFVPNGCCPIDPPAITADGGNRVYKNPNDPTDTTIYIKSKGKTALGLQFVITPANTYTANTISFAQLLGDPNGTATFTNPTPSNNTITVTDVFKAAPRWSYSIGITQIATGATGTIDPGIENTDES